MILLAKDSNLLKLPELLYGTIKRVGILNKEPILYGDVNLLKPNDLYYIIGAKLVYRYVKASIEDSSITYYFNTIKSMATDGLSVPEDERGHIRNAGYLFKGIIYSGDPNLVKNGNWFYHDTLPYISIVSNVDGVINLSTKELNEEGEITTVVTDYRVSPELRDYSKDYLTFEALEDGTFTLTVPAGVDSTYMTSVSYSTDNGATWTDTTIDNTAQTITTPTITSGSKVLWKGVGKQMAKLFSAYSCFSSTDNFNVSGNIMSLLYGDEFVNQEALPSDSMYNFCNLFRNNKLTSARNLILPATTLVDSCYREMFQGCTSLTTAPELPATTLVNGCYYQMFRGCTSLTTAPGLPATTVADYCYSGMFWNCKSLNTSPVLPAATLVSNCYYQMFYDCSNLNYIKAMFTTIPSADYTGNWVRGVAAKGTFVKDTIAQWDVTGDNGVPSGWTVEIAFHN